MPTCIGYFVRGFWCDGDLKSLQAGEVGLPQVMKLGICSILAINADHALQIRQACHMLCDIR
jgi:hypothetical protein